MVHEVLRDLRGLYERSTEVKDPGEMSQILQHATDKAAIIERETRHDTRTSRLMIKRSKIRTACSMILTRIMEQFDILRANKVRKQAAATM